MCIFKECPIFESCEKEVEQVVYCRHVEMIKKIGLMRLELRRKNETAGAASTPTKEPIQVRHEPVSEPTATSQVVSAALIH